MESSSKPSAKNKQELCNKTPEMIGILSFEVANVISKIVHLHKKSTTKLWKKKFASVRSPSPVTDGPFVVVMMMMLRTGLQEKLGIVG